MGQNGPSFTKATYDNKRPKKQPPSSVCIEAELEEKKRIAAKSREFDKRVTKVGLAQALFPNRNPEEPLKRRKL